MRTTFWSRPTRVCGLGHFRFSLAILLLISTSLVQAEEMQEPEGSPLSIGSSVRLKLNPLPPRPDGNSGLFSCKLTAMANNTPTDLAGTTKRPEVPNVLYTGVQFRAKGWLNFVTSDGKDYETCNAGGFRWMEDIDPITPDKLCNYGKGQRWWNEKGTSPTAVSLYNGYSSKFSLTIAQTGGPPAVKFVLNNIDVTATKKLVDQQLPRWENKQTFAGHIEGPAKQIADCNVEVKVECAGAQQDAGPIFANGEPESNKAPEWFGFQFKQMGATALNTAAKTSNCTWEGCYGGADQICDDPWWNRGNQGGCFLGGTKILMENRLVRTIESLKRGDRVWNPKLSRGVAIRHMVRGPEAHPIFRIGYAAIEVNVTSTHPMVTDKGLVQARRLKRGSRILGADGSFHAITTLEQISSKHPPLVYNIELDGTSDGDSHLLVADGVVTGDLYLQRKLEAPVDTLTLVTY